MTSVLATYVPDEAFQKPSQVEVINAIGQVHILCPFPPMSLQADSQRAEEYQTAIRHGLRTTAHIYTGRLECELRWFVGPTFFYEHGHRPDIDNLLKKTLDACSGNEGLWVDDTQVEEVKSRAILTNGEDKGWFVLTVDFSNSDWQAKNVPFIAKDDRFCVPNTGRQGQYELGSALLAHEPKSARGLMGVARPFLYGHVWRGNFEIVDASGDIIPRRNTSSDGDDGA